MKKNKTISEHMREIGSKGGKATAAKKGKKYMSKIGRKGYEALVRSKGANKTK